MKKKTKIKEQQQQYRYKNNSKFNERVRIYGESHKQQRQNNEQVRRENNREELNLKRKMAFMRRNVLLKKRESKISRLWNQ